MYLFTEPNSLFPSLKNKTKKLKPGRRHLIGVMQTSDVLGSPDNKYGNVNVFSNGGRIQPGCYDNDTDIRQCNFIILYISKFLI